MSTYTTLFSPAAGLGEYDNGMRFLQANPARSDEEPVVLTSGDDPEYMRLAAMPDPEWPQRKVRLVKLYAKRTLEPVVSVAAPEPLGDEAPLRKAA